MDSNGSDAAVSSSEPLVSYAYGDKPSFSPSNESRSHHRSNEASDELISNSEAEDSSIHSQSRRQKRERSSVDEERKSSSHEMDYSAPKRAPTGSKWENDDDDASSSKSSKRRKLKESPNRKVRLETNTEAKIRDFAHTHTDASVKSEPAVGPAKPTDADDIDPFSVYGYPDADEMEVGGADALPADRHGSFLPNTPPGTSSQRSGTPPISPNRPTEPAPRPPVNAPTPPPQTEQQPPARAIPRGPATYGNFFTGCRTVDDAYDFIRKIGDGTYGTVYKARDLATNEIVALKRVKMENEKEGFPLISLREIKVLMQSQHPNIGALALPLHSLASISLDPVTYSIYDRFIAVNAKEIVVGPEGTSFFIVMEYIEHDLHSLMEDVGKPWTVSEVKLLLHQLISAVHHLHEHWIIHRDIKTSNLLYSNKGYLKLCDMGLAREYYDPPRKMTPNVVTLWYRAPEVLLGMEQYGEPIDMWSIGCIFGELLDLKPMFDGRGEIDQLKKIFALLGAPNAAVWPEYPVFMKSKGFAIQDTNRYNHLKSRYPQLTSLGYDLMNRLLAYDPKKRISAADAMAHPWFSERPLAKEIHLMPTFPSRSDGGRPSQQQQQQRVQQIPQDVQQSMLLQEQQHMFGAHERHYERG